MVIFHSYVSWPEGSQNMKTTYVVVLEIVWGKWHTASYSKKHATPFKQKAMGGSLKFP